MNNTTLSSIRVIFVSCWLAMGVAWADAPFPVPVAGGLVECQADLAKCNDDFDSCDTALDACTMALGTCNDDLTDCQIYADYLEVQIKQCNSDLLKCQANTQAFPATGQTTCYRASGPAIECTGTGQDGEIQAGATLDYADTGLTIIDNNTKLEWEKKDDSGGLHDKDNEYRCFIDTEFDAYDYVAALNASAFAGHADWRLPNVKELLSIVNYEESYPAVSYEFHRDCVEGCTFDSCSCNASGYSAAYWSSTTEVQENFGWFVRYDVGAVSFTDKYNLMHVRAVRGGLID